MLAVLLVTFTSLAALSATKLHENCDELYKGFKLKWNRKYPDQEDQLRNSVFCANMLKADKLNDLNGSPAFGVSKYADRTDEEFKVLLGRKDNGKPVPEKFDLTKIPKSKNDIRGPLKKPQEIALSGSLPTTVDWVAEGATTPIKNQGQCGSCWAHSVAEEVESQWIMNGNTVWEFSVQQVTSCTASTRGCGGGDTVYGYEYLMGLPAGQGLGSAAFAPYVQSMYTTCQFMKCTDACSNIDLTALETEELYTGYYADVTGYSYATAPCSGACNTQNMTEVATNLALNGPASICVNAGAWNLYTGGVLTQAACGGYASSDLDHCVQLVGYNTEDPANPYWVARNSWATDWGVNGYIYLQYPLNTCGLANEATYVTLA